MTTTTTTTATTYRVATRIAGPSGLGVRCVVDAILGRSRPRVSTARAIVDAARRLGLLDHVAPECIARAEERA